MSSSAEEGQLQDYSVDQLAGAVVLVLGAVAGLLQVIWMSKCHCKVNLCYFFRCERRPPTEEEMATLKATMDKACLLYTSPSPRDRTRSRMPSSA